MCQFWRVYVCVCARVPVILKILKHNSFLEKKNEKEEEKFNF